MIVLNLFYWDMLLTPLVKPLLTHLIVEASLLTIALDVLTPTWVSEGETIWAEENFEQMALHNGVIIQSNLTDDGAFKANVFVTQICYHEQHLCYCGLMSLTHNLRVIRSSLIDNFAHIVVFSLDLCGSHI